MNNKKELIANLEALVLYVKETEKRTTAFVKKKAEEEEKNEEAETKKIESLENFKNCNFSGEIILKENEFFNSRSPSFDLEFFKRICSGNLEEEEKGFDFKLFEREMNL